MCKSHVNYVCPRCFYQVEDCICELTPYNLIMIDKNIQECIRTLNKKGYKTMNSCEGHYKYSYTYIQFADLEAIMEISEPPKGFRYLPNHRTVEASNMRGWKMSEEEFSELVKTNIESLTEWCNKLP